MWFKRLIMLQRIQSFYLFLAICLNVALFFVVLAQLKIETFYHNFTLSGLRDAVSGEELYSSITLAVFCSLSILISAVVIFMFKKRQQQIKLSQLNLFIQMAFVATIFFMVEDSAAVYTAESETMIEYGAGSLLSLTPLVFIYLAIRSIKKDEALVRAADRIR